MGKSQLQLEIGSFAPPAGGGNALTGCIGLFFAASIKKYFPKRDVSHIFIGCFGLFLSLFQICSYIFEDPCYPALQREIIWNSESEQVGNVLGLKALKKAMKYMSPKQISSKSVFVHMLCMGKLY